MPRKQKPLTFFADLPEEERHHIYLVLQNHTYKEVADYIYQNHGKLVSETTIARFYHRCCEDERLETLPEIRENADAWLHYKETGETTRFDEAALELIKLKTFELAATLRNPAEFAQLNGLSRILFAARLAEVRERTTTVRERRLALDERKQQWRESIDERACRNSDPVSTGSSPRPRVSESPRVPQEEPYDPNKPESTYDYPKTGKPNPCIDGTLWDRDVIAAIHARYFGPPIPPHLYWHKDKEIWSTEPLPVLSERERNPWLVRHDDDEEEQAELSTQLEETNPEED